MGGMLQGTKREGMLQGIDKREMRFFQYPGIPLLRKPPGKNEMLTEATLPFWEGFLRKPSQQKTCTSETDVFSNSIDPETLLNKTH